nr:uncharacterized protein LOC100213839 isoform X5 [Hydra vulgaris]
MNHFYLLFSHNHAGKKKFWLFVVLFIIQRIGGSFSSIVIGNYLIRVVYKNTSNEIEISSLKNNSKLPDVIDFTESFDSPNFTSIYYGQRIYGWIQVKQTGAYGFYISCKSSCELYISLNEDPTNISRIISQKNSSLQSSWTQYPEDCNPKYIYLKSNSKYYIEVLMTGNSDEDHLSIEAQLMGSQTFKISKTWLSNIKIVVCASGSICDVNEYDICINDKVLNLFICTCKSGYEYKNGNLFCTDLDECTYLCNGDGLTCKNFNGSFQCVCPVGFSYNYTSLQCEDLDECTYLCNGDGLTCKNFNGSFQCVCPVGFSYNYTSLQCEDLDECTYLCNGDGLTCKNFNGSFQCVCPVGFSYNYTSLQCEDLDECTYLCNGDGLTCKNFNGSFQCVCPVGFSYNYTSLQCEDLDECTYLCNGDGLTCKNFNGSFQCVCPVGFFYNYTSLQCEDVDECTYLCNGDGLTCKNFNGSFQCVCPVGFFYNYTSLQCEDLDECTYLCNGDGLTCKNFNGSFQCVCPVGFSYNYTSLQCEDVDKCTYLCNGDGLTCKNFNGLFQCVCPVGFFYNYTSLQCEDVDECTYLCNGDGLICNNLNGSFQCVCPVGFSYNYTSLQCEDVDECTYLCNGDGLICKNFNGSFQCVCPVGFSYNYTSLQCDNECTKLCKGNFTCIYKYGSLQCVCPVGSIYNSISYQCEVFNECLIFCSKKSNDDDDDKSNGFCKQINGNYKCTCSIGYFFNYTSAKCQVARLIQEVYLNFSSEHSLQSLKNSLSYPQFPDFYKIISNFNIQTNNSENYGQRIRGWLQVKLSGNYTFYSSCKGVCQFFISTDNDPLKKRMLINQTQSSICCNWNQYPNQVSDKILLWINKRYYIEAVMIGHNFDGHIAIGLKLNGISITPTLLTSSQLSPIRISFPESQLHDNEICISENSNYSLCTCQNGFSYYNGNLMCSDINECYNGINDCNWDHSKCINLIGNYSCSCQNGWQLVNNQRYCEDVNECTYLCKGGNLTCNNLDGSYICICPVGFHYNYNSLQCDDVDECTFLCKGEILKCNNLIGSYTCDCPVGFSYNYTSLQCDDVNECSYMCRANNYTCINMHGSYQCVCPVGFSNNFTNLPCDEVKKCAHLCKSDNRTCNNLNGSFQCVCPVGYFFNYTSLQCDDINECAYLCKGDDLKCNNLVGLYNCVCPVGFIYNYTSQQCEDVNECVFLCKDDKNICNNLNGSYLCECPNGFLFNYTTLQCDDVNECTYLCKGGNLTCNNLFGSYTCICPVGFSYNYNSSQCDDIDECPFLCKGENLKCNNLIGSYTCDCPVGFLYNYTSLQCGDVNECTYLCKGGNLTCNNLVGSYTCICPFGFSYNYNSSQCDDVDECTFLCKGEILKCNNLIGSYTCDCPVGFSYNYTSLQCDDVNECSYMCRAINYTCINMHGSYQCVCPVGFSNNFTNLPCDEVKKCAHLCKSDNRTCNNLNGSFQCVCPVGYFFNYTSLQCDDINECAYLCKGDDLKCNNLVGLYNCVCPVGFIYNYTSQQCEDVNECVFLCKDENNICNNINGSYLCDCPDGYLFNYTTLHCDEFMFGRNGIGIYIEGNVLYGKNIEPVVTVVNGTKLKIELDFGDGTSPNLKFFTPNVDDLSPVSLMFSHKYSQCGKYSVSVRVINLSSKTSNSTIYVNLTNVTVYCYLSEIKLDYNSSSQLVIPVNNEFRLNVSQASGSYVNYTVNWGDGISEFRDQSQNLFLLPFFAKHIYTREGNYTISVIAMNAVQTMNKSFNLFVFKSSQPDIDFNYGTKEKPISILHIVDYNFTANISKKLDKSIIENASFQWVMSGLDFEVKLRAVFLNYQIVYTLKKNEIAIGSYNLSLLFTYNNFTSVFTAFFSVLKIPLFVEIEGGFYRTVAHKKIINNNTAYNNFSISAEKSYDPEDPQAKFEGISFQWRCKLMSNFSSGILATTDVVFTSKLCINDSWVLLDVSGPIILFNTKMFLVGETYMFEVYATKGFGYHQQGGSFIQEITFSENVFDVQLICLINCDERLNFQQSTVFSYTCIDCERCIIQPYWTILDDQENIPSELSQNNLSTSFNDTSLIINAGVLLESKNYTFILQVACTGLSFLSTFKIKKMTCSLPRPGACYISPLIGYAVKTSFNITCEGWSTAEGSLSYLFFYENGQYKLSNSNSGYMLLNSKTFYQSYLNNILLGAGDEHNNYTVQLFVHIAGKYGAFIEFNSISIQVLPNLQEMNLTNILSTVDKNDTQKLMISIQAIASVVNREQNLIEYQTLRNEMIGMLASVTFSNLNDVKLVSDCLSALSNYPSELVLNTQVVAANIARNIGEFLCEVNIKSLSFVSFYNTTQSLLQFVSNIFVANANVVNDSINYSQSQQNSFNKSQSDADVVSKLLGFMEDYFYVLQAYKIPGEIATTGSTAAFDFFLKKELKDNLSNMTISSGFILSDAKEMFNQSLKNIPIIVNNLRLKNQPYTWDIDRSKNIASELQSLSMSTTERLPINVNNLQQPIIIAILNKPEKIRGYNLSLSAPEEPKVLSLKLTSSLCNMMLKFSASNDPSNLTFLIVFLQFGKVPTKNDYDIRLNISNKDGVVLTKNRLAMSFNASEEVSFGQKNNLTNSEIKNSSFFVERNQQAHLLDGGTLILWDFQNSTYAFLNNSVLYISFFYVGPMPAKKLEENSYTYDEKEYEGEFIYEMKSYCSECNYWNEISNKWMSDGCQLDFETTSFEVTKCKCKHLTGFGGFYVAPNVIQKPSLALLKKGYLLLVIVTIILLFWICGLIFARRMDIKDNTKYGVCPLPDNSPEDSYLYQITVNTGDRIHAGTNSKIFFILAGDISKTKTHRLIDSERQCFQRSASDSFILTTPNCLGDLTYIRLWHDNKGGGWYLRNVEVLDLQTDKRYYFMAKCWIAIDKGDCLLDVTIPVSASDELTHFSYLFTTRVRNDFFEKHLWFSVFTRPPRSIFNRCERLSVAVLLVVVQMTASTMFYGKVSNDPVNNNKVLGINFSWQQIYVALISACITVPVELIFVHVFHLINPFYKFALKKKDIESNTCSTFDENNFKKEIKKKKGFYLPYWAKYVTWSLCVIAILSCSCVVLLFGMSFGNKKSLDWLISVILSMVHDVFVMQPMKIFIIAIITALAIKKIDDKQKYFADDQAKILAHNENWLHNFHKRLSIFERVELDISPPDKHLIESIKESRMHKLRLYSLVRELLFYLIFALLVFYLAYASHGNYSFTQTNNIESLFNLRSDSSSTKQHLVLKQLRSKNDFWVWLNSFFFLQVFPEPWSNKKSDGNIFINDFNSKIINGIRIRQARVKSHSCLKPSLVADLFILDCLSELKSSLEETNDFDFDWSLPKKYSFPINQSTKPWRYQTSNELDGYPFGAKLQTYFGGGYVIEIFPKWNNKKVIEDVKKHMWIDRQTRAIFIEFALFNAATNNFNMVTFVFEFPASGGLIPSYSVSTFKLYPSENDAVIIGCQLIFFVMMFIFTIRECRMLRRTGWKYFKGFWNLTEVMLVLLSIQAVVFFFYRGKLAKDLLNRLPAKEPQKFINFQFASYWDLMFTYIVSLIVFIVNIKFMKILNFNPRISMMSATLKASSHYLITLAFTLFVIMSAMVCFSNIAFGAVLEGYKSYFETTVSLMSLVLGKFDFNQIQNSCGYIGPLFLFAFNIWMNWIMMSLFISILNNGFLTVRSKAVLQKDEYNILNFFESRLKGLLGLSYKKSFNSEIKNCNENLKSVKFNLDVQTDLTIPSMYNEESDPSSLDDKLSELSCLMQKYYDDTEVLILPLFHAELFYGNFMEAFNLKKIIIKEMLEHNQSNESTEDS